MTEYENKNRESQMKENLKSLKKERNKSARQRLFIGLLIIVIIILLLVRACGAKEDNKQQNAFDPTKQAPIEDVRIDGMDPEEIQEELNRQVEAGMITISMNAEPVFPNGTAPGNLLIENDEGNKDAQVIQIIVDDTQEVIYTSGMIPVGKYVNEDTLDVNLAAGDYPCTAYFNAVNEDGSIVGTAAARITVHVKG